MPTDRQIAESLQQLRHLLGTEERESNFAAPSFLKEVPSFISNETMPREGREVYAELGGGSGRNRG